MALQLAQRIIFLMLICCVTTLHAQTVYYPAQSSDLLKLTATDVAALFNRSIPNDRFATQEYTSMPTSGFVFIYDSTMINDQSCKIECNGDLIKFSAAQDAGLCFGIYNYLDELGFRFYLPGKLWEKIPTLSSPYKQENKIVVQKFKYNGWFISGGYNRWAMDMIDPNGENFGINGHDWAQYQHRNNMNGAYRFSGHRGDIFNADYFSTLKANPCYTACNNGERKVNPQSVPDINNADAEAYWASTILQRYTYYKNSIAGNPSLYKNFYHNFNYDNEYIGIEVPDGSVWGNSSDNLGCVKGNFNGDPYPKISDQQFMLANFTAFKINNILSGKRFQCYAYSNHADVPSANIAINKNIDVQVVATAFQSESSPIGLLNRWYKRHANISEYDYMNIPQWTGETPIFSLPDYKNTLARIKQMKSQGLVIETSPAKFASLPFLFAGNRYLQYDVNVDSSLHQFTSNMFPPNVAVHINQLLNYWGDNVMNAGDFTTDNKYKIPLFLQEMSKAIAASKNVDADVVARLQEFKAYLHYIVLYYDFIGDNRSYQNKSDKAANLCLYLAKINKLQLVNSYFLILDIVNKFPVESSFYKEYNVTDGKAYLNGSLPSITDEEINNFFSEDVTKYAASVTDFKFEKALDIITKMKAAGLKPLDKIKVGIGYTNGYDYPGKYQFYFYSPAAGSININCTPTFNMPAKGFINFTVEGVDKPLLVIKDETISRENNPGNINITIPSAGLYVITTTSKFMSDANLIITTNGNTFFKGGPFYGKRAESYRLDTLKSLPKYFYVPNISEVYFSINNSCYTNSCLSPEAVQRAFGIKDNNGQPPVIEVSPFDSSLYKIAISSASAGTFWQVTNLREYNFCFANISNIEIYAERKPVVVSAALPVLPNDAAVIYPNPSNGIFNFKKNNSPLLLNTINVYDPQGEKIINATNTSSINLSDLPAGVYIFSAQKENDIIKGKLIKN
jgi:hypothetical protein